MKKFVKFVFIFLVLGGILFATSCFILDKIKASQENEIMSLKAKIAPMMFNVVQKDDAFEVTYSFLDLSGNVIKQKTSLIRGNELFVDCIVKNFNSNVKVAFPVVLYSNLISSSEGVEIVNDYNNDSFPEIFRGVTAREAKQLQKLYKEVLNETKDRNAFRSSPHVVVTNKKVEYQLVSRIRGGLEILKADTVNEKKK